MRRVTVVMFALLALVTLARLFLIGQFELSPDEAYYWLWSERLDWAYYSKGPMVAVAIWAGTSVFGACEFGVRFLSPLLVFGTSAILYLLARRLYGEREGVWAMALGLAVPIFHVGSVVMTIDALSIFFWSAAMYAFWRALEGEGRLGIWWPLAGLLMGLGFLSKYTNALQLVSVAGLLVLGRRRDRRMWRHLGVYAMLAVFALCTLPPVIWNAAREWVTVAHLGARGGLTTGGWALRPLEFLEFVGLHLGVYSPLIFVGLIWALVAMWARGRAEFRVVYLLWFAVPILVLYAGLSLNRVGEANWTAPGFLSVSVLAAAYWVRRCAGARWARVLVGVALGIGLTMGVLVLNTDLARRCGVPWPYERDPGGRLRGWRSLAEGLATIRTNLEERLGERVFLIANRYGTAAELSFYLPGRRVEGVGHPPVYMPETQEFQNQFAFWPRYDENVLPEDLPEGVEARASRRGYSEEVGVNPFEGRSALFVTDDVSPDGAEPESPHEVLEGFGDWERIGDLTVERLGRRVRVLRVFACYDYQGKDL